MSEPEILETILFVDREMSRSEVFTAGGGIVLAHSEPAPVEGHSNEDAALLLRLGEQASVLAVADGVGGGPAGGQAAAVAVHAFSEAVTSDIQQGAELRHAVLDGFEAANLKVLELGIGARTTLVAAEISAGIVRTYHAGDSEALVVGQRGKLKLTTTAHSPVGYAVEAGVLDQEEAISHEDRHLVSNVLGDPSMKIEVGPQLRLAPRDTLLLASDGLFDNMLQDEVVAAIRTGPLPSVSERLLSTCRTRMLVEDPEQPGKPDDLTFLVFRIGSSRA